MASLTLNQNKNTEDQPYSIEPNRWYKAFPYGFAYWSFDAKKGDSATETFWLPIAPNNINVVTHYATNIVTTLYGIIEEHSEVRYFDITISGNTGIAPKFTTPFVGGGELPATDKGGFGSALKGKISLPNTNPGYPSTGRDFFMPDALGGALNKLGGFLPEVANTIGAAANLAKGIASGGADTNETGIKPEQSGYLAFHNFYKFLLRYKSDASRSGSEGSAATLQVLANSLANNFTGVGRSKLRAEHPLQFLNYKDNIKYNVIPISFTLVRSAENPMLYNYNIRMRAYGLQNVTAKPPETTLLADLGLGDLEGSLFASMTGLVGKASTLISGLGGAL